jgi:hypothetical protein
MTQMRPYTAKEFQQIKPLIGDTLGDFFPFIQQETQNTHSEGPATNLQNVPKPKNEGESE